MSFAEECATNLASNGLQEFRPRSISVVQCANSTNTIQQSINGASMAVQWQEKRHGAPLVHFYTSTIEYLPLTISELTVTASRVVLDS